METPSMQPISYTGDMTSNIDGSRLAMLTPWAVWKGSSLIGLMRAVRLLSLLTIKGKYCD